MKKVQLPILISALCCGLGAQSENIDLLIIHDNYSERYFNGNVPTAMQSWANDINQMYRASNVDLILNVVGIKERDIPGSNMSQMLGTLRRDSQVKAWRDEVGADFVAMLSEKGECGIGYMAVDKNWAFNIVGPDCGSSTLAHELGHNMGLGHSWRQGDTGGARYNYALGHGVDYEFATIMAYAWKFNAKRAGQFSNPRQQCDGFPCGVPEGQMHEADSAKALTNVLSDIAEFRPTVIVNTVDPQDGDDDSGGNSDVDNEGATSTEGSTNSGDTGSTGNTSDTNGTDHTDDGSGVDSAGGTDGSNTTPVQAGQGDGLFISYYNDMNLSNYVVSQRVKNIDVNWGLRAPHSGVNHNFFSVRWDGEIEARHSETYTFYIKSDNGRRVWINDELVIDAWFNDWRATYIGEIAMQAGERVRIRVEMYEKRGRASAKLEWSSPSQAREVVPASQLYQKF